MHYPAFVNGALCVDVRNANSFVDANSKQCLRCNRWRAWTTTAKSRANKPLHELRKEVGAVIATEQGIFAASRFLRHSDITTTARHYADQKARINVGLGKFLDTEIRAVAQPARTAVA